MTFSELSTKLEEIYEAYYDKSNHLTSVQKESFYDDFEEQYDVQIGMDISEKMNKKWPGLRRLHDQNIIAKNVDVEDIVEVINVEKRTIPIKSFWKNATAGYIVRVQVVNSNIDFEFSAKIKSNADKLHRGQKITITGNVNASIRPGEYEEYSTSYLESAPFIFTFDEY